MLQTVLIYGKKTKMQTDAPPTEPENNLVPVVITLVDGERLKGSVSVPHTKNLGDVLNGPDLFILFKVNGGDLIYLAQKTIAAVQSNKIPDAQQLDQTQKHYDHASPYEILNLKQGVDRKTARDAYHKMIKQYHPDQFLNTPLPAEVQTYFEAVVLRLNAAYNDLLDELEQLEKLKQLKAQQQEQQKNRHQQHQLFWSVIPSRISPGISPAFLGHLLFTPS